MSSLLAIDPGISLGWCLLQKGYIRNCGGGKVDPPISAWDRAIIECPFVYPHRSGVDPNDLIKLAVQVGSFKGRLETLGVPVRMVFPAQWKGQLEKDVHHPRILKAIQTDEERKIVATASKGLNKKALGDMLDAIGLAQWAFKSWK